ncbi:helix-turn-helix domain-containing protein [Streptomyces sp. NBC_00986]|uniref:helix-turn-helix domain-containing protein n=1 Tax=Streptomyces sp. NBC_00986 TaxID=2903702 RepID=UPI00386519FC|nr:helix-turn-helix domain-containing protein [Streptomyces sp. NBC_00986]
MRRYNACLKPPDADANGIVNISFAEPENTTKAISPIEARQRERHAIVHALLDQGHGIQEIARELHMGRNTVRRVARVETPEQMLNGRHQPRPSQLDLHAELKELGYQGSYQIISDYLRPRRRRRIRVVGPAPPGVRHVTSWMMRHPDRLRDEERELFAGILARCPEVAAAEQLVRSSVEILTARSGQHLKDWILAAQTEDLPGLHSFAHGWRRTGTPSSRD